MKIRVHIFKNRSYDAILKNYDILTLLSLEKGATPITTKASAQQKTAPGLQLLRCCWEGLQLTIQLTLNSKHVKSSQTAFALAKVLRKH